MSKVIEYQLYNGHLYSAVDKHWNSYSYNDEPACINTYGGRYSYSYYGNGGLHRDDAPALIYSDDRLGYYNKGKRYQPKCQKL